MISTLSANWVCGLVMLAALAAGDASSRRASSTPAVNDRAIVLEAESPVRQRGSQGKDAKQAASAGEVLGLGFGADAGDFGEYTFTTDDPMTPARITLRYARGFDGWGFLDVTLDGKQVGRLRYQQTGGWGTREAEFGETSLVVPSIAAGDHELRFTVAELKPITEPPAIPIPKAPILDMVGRRDDKNSVGHGRNVAVYTGTPSTVFFATYNLTHVFDAADGATLEWYPDHVRIDPDRNPSTRSNVNLDRIEISEDPQARFVPTPPDSNRPVGLVEQRQVCVTRDDVIISVVHLTNRTDKSVTHSLTISGDSRQARDWRGNPGGPKVSRRVGDAVVVTDHNAYRDVLPKGISFAVGGSIEPSRITPAPPGGYQMRFDVAIAPNESRRVVFGCAVATDDEVAVRRLRRALQVKDPIAANRRDWQTFYRRSIPTFHCSDKGLSELYAFRWFLLRFSTVGGDLGLFRYPVVLEGRQAYQTYCCYSAPFMAFDMNWAVDGQVGFGHIASMVEAAHPDGRLPWYTSPATNEVPIHHRSGTGLSLLPVAAWTHYVIHGDKARLARIYPGLKRNVEWWIEDRDADSNGLFVIDHQLETGMDDLGRWDDPKLRYEAVDATSYAVANLRAVAAMAHELGKPDDADRLKAYARKAAEAVNTELWHKQSQSYRDRHPQTGDLADVITITTFYPYFAGIGGPDHMSIFSEHLLDPEEFWTPHPVPALPKDAEDFNPTGFWQGPSWPAATSHVVHAFAGAAKTHDRQLLPKAAILLRHAASNHLQPRPDFYERYNPLTGEPLSTFRDYMHSWWIDIILRHVAGITPQNDGSLVIDPLPLGLESFTVSGAPYRSGRVDVRWKKPGGDEDGSDGGLVVRYNGATVLKKPDFKPGDPPVQITAASLAGTEGG